MTVAGVLYQSLLRRTNPLIVPLEDRRVLRKLASAPMALSEDVKRGIDASISYFESQIHIALAPFIMLVRLAKTRIEPKLQIFEDRAESYFCQYSHPHLRLVDRDFLPDAEATADTSSDYDNPVHQLMTRCLYADRNGDGRSCIALLRELEDRGGYGSTHIAVGGLILRELAAAPAEEIDELLEPIPAILSSAQRIDRAGDLFAERIAVLQWLDRHSDVDPVWIARLLRAQCSDGGWNAGPSLRRAKPNHHTSVLALISLIQWKQQFDADKRGPLEPFWGTARKVHA